VGFEPAVPVFERAKAAAAMIGGIKHYAMKMHVGVAV
jgi:hypothetical protein